MGLAKPSSPDPDGATACINLSELDVFSQANAMHWLSVESYSKLKERRSLLLAIGTTAVPESCSPERTAACCHPSCTGDISAEGKMSPKGLANHGEETRSPAGSSRFPPAQYWPPLQQVDERFLKRIHLYKITSLHTYLVTPHFY